MASLASLIPLILFLLVALAASIVVRRRADAAGGGFVNSYFIGNRALGGFVLAMTTIATYGSVSSFVGGPGQAWQIGFGWVYMAVVQVTALVLLYGIFGKKMALISRKLDAVTVVDVIRARYGSNALANAVGARHRAVLRRHHGGPVRRRREALRGGDRVLLPGGPGAVRGGGHPVHHHRRFPRRGRDRCPVRHHDARGHRGARRGHSDGRGRLRGHHDLHQGDLPGDA